MTPGSPHSTPRIVAQLGPTNTGKTHRAVERMLEHASGMIGLPLRLLAREVYDRVTARVGEQRVALLTGEEKRIPPHADYWICTVGSMPSDRPVDFLAVDEIQLAAHRERGHVFTDRLLHARGRRETWFLGSDTMRPLIRTLIPEASFERADRLSKLSYFGRSSLKALPPRTAVVAFSRERVYELAESLRRLRGGVAVVLGALSPRTRNAQVAMYQAGEVQYLVATDAIGMGLNLDVSRIAFAEVSKFDGGEHRPLWPDELAQIAGRAGRHLNDGTFGTLSTLPELSERVVSAIESHRFAPVRSLVWRNGVLDFTSPEALLDSLSSPPRNPAFARVERADDFDALKALSRLPEVRRVASDRAGVALLWQVCQIPDFRKRWFGQHVALLRETFLQLSANDGQLDPGWLEENLWPLDDVSGDIHTLMDRLAAIRVWTYISHRPSWLAEPEPFQERTRRLEDALGDALHARLVERFVERSARNTQRRFRRETPEPQPASGSPFAKLKELVGEWDGGAQAPSEAQFVEQVVGSTHEAFEVDATGRISLEGEPLGRLVRGTDRRSPQIAPVDADLWTGGARRRLERRLMALARDLVTEAMGGFPAESFAGAGASGPSRGLAYRLAEGFGVVPYEEAHEQWRLLDGEARERFHKHGLREGHRFLYISEAMTLHALERRSLLTALFDQKAVPEGIPREPVLSSADFVGRVAQSFGYHVIGPVALRVDVVERLSEGLRAEGNSPWLKALFQELRLEGATRERVMRELGGNEISKANPGRRRRRRRKNRAGPVEPKKGQGG